MIKRKLSAAIIGAGKIGAFYDNPKSKDILTHAHGYVKHPNFDLVGIVDADFAKAQKAAKIWQSRPYKNISELFDKQAVEVVSVCVSTENHFQVLRELEKYKNLKGGLIEKPLTGNLGQADRIIKSSFYQQRKFSVNYIRNYIPEFIAIKKAIKKGEYGALLNGQVYYGKGLLNNGSHALAWLDFLGFKFRHFTKFGQFNDFYNRQDPSCSFVLNVQKNANIIFTAIPQNKVSIFEIDLIFAQGRLRFVNNGFQLESYLIEESAMFKGYLKFGLEPKIINTSLNRYGYFGADSLYQALSTNSKVVYSLADAYKIQALCDKIIKAK